MIEIKFLKCTNDDVNAICTCVRPFVGPICGQIDDCYSSPCQNGGTCVSFDLGGFQCFCPPYLSGILCEISLTTTSTTTRLTTTTTVSTTTTRTTTTSSSQPTTTTTTTTTTSRSTTTTTITARYIYYLYVLLRNFFLLRI